MAVDPSRAATVLKAAAVLGWTLASAAAGVWMGSRGEQGAVLPALVCAGGVRRLLVGAYTRSAAGIDYGYGAGAVGRSRYASVVSTSGSMIRAGCKQVP